MSYEEAKYVLTHTTIVPGRVQGKTVFGEALRMALTAIDRQIPKKIVLKYMNLGRSKCYCCPTCDNFFGYQYDKPIEEFYTKHCPECGQALDWTI